MTPEERKQKAEERAQKAAEATAETVQRLKDLFEKNVFNKVKKPVDDFIAKQDEKGAGPWNGLMSPPPPAAPKQPDVPPVQETKSEARPKKGRYKL